MTEDKDLILLAEFCEVDGPRAIVTVPAGREASSFQGNHNFSHSVDDFILQIMATDYQNFNGDKCKAESDVVCIRTHILPGVHGLLHYFTLQDPDARGWVRPACVAYITHNVAKLKYLQQSILNLFELCTRTIQQDNVLCMEERGSQTQGYKDSKIIQLLRSHGGDVDRSLSDGNGTTRWTSLCPRGFRVACWCLLQFYRQSVFSLQDLILRNFEKNITELTSNWESFTNVSAAKNDAEYLSLVSDVA